MPLNDSSSFERFFTVNKTLLRLMGVLSLDGSQTRSKKLISLGLFVWNVAANVFLLGTQIYSVYSVGDDIDELTNVVGPFMPQFAGFTKLLILRYYRNEMSGMIEKCTTCWELAESDEERNILRYYAGRGKDFTIAVCTAAVTTATIFIAEALYQNVRSDETYVRMILAIALKLEKGSISYPLLFGLEALAMATVVSAIVANTIQPVFMLQGCAQFRMLRVWFGEMIEEFRANVDDSGRSEQLSKKELNRVLRKCVSHHQAVLNFCDLIQVTAGLILLVEVMTSLFTICLGGFNVLLAKSTTEICKYAIFVAYGLTQLLMYCWTATDLALESEAVADAAFGYFAWIEAPQPVRTSILLVTARAQRTVTLRAGKFSIISLELFASIVTNAYTVFTLLRSYV